MKINKGITLIALIITIIVMLILVSVSISIAIKTGLFEQAGNATKKYRGEQEKESNLSKITVGGVEYDSVEDYIAKNNGASQNAAKWVYVDNGDETIEITGIDLRGKKSEKKTQLTNGNSYDTITLKLQNDTLIIPDEIEGKRVISVSLTENLYDGMIEADYDTWLIINGVKNLIYSDNIEQIKNQAIAFKEVENLHLPSELKDISNTEMNSCPLGHFESLQSVIIPSKVENIGYGAFFGCSNLKNVRFAGAPKTIGQDVFIYTGIDELTFPEGVEEIGRTYDLGNETITLPKSLKKFDGIGMGSRNATISFPNGINENLTIPEDKWGASKVIVEGVEQ